MDGFILAGGLSSRMGSTKSEVMLDGVRFIDRAVNALSDVSSGRIHIVGGTSLDTLRRARLVPDTKLSHNDYSLGGPIIGIYTALLAATTNRIAVLACDLPLVTSEVFLKLADARWRNFDAVVPIQHDGFAQPLCAIYQRDRCLTVVENAISRSSCSIMNLLSLLNTNFVEAYEFNNVPYSINTFLNVNTPEEFQSAAIVTEKSTSVLRLNESKAGS